MSTPKVSVIVPFYNVDLYITECIQSILGQTMSAIEVICVDDGSTDKSLEICKAFAAKDERITVVECTKSKRPGGARNEGIHIARGEYIWFLDSDDLFASKNVLETVIRYATKTNADIVITDSCQTELDNFDFTKLKYCNLDGNPKEDVNYSFKNDQAYAKFPYSVCCWNKLYRRSIFNNPEFLFPEHILFEDMPFAWKLYCSNAFSIYVLKYPSVIYRVRSGSIMTTKGNDALIQRSSIQVILTIYQYLENHQKFELFKKSFSIMIKGLLRDSKISRNLRIQILEEVCKIDKIKPLVGGSLYYLRSDLKKFRRSFYSIHLKKEYIRITCAGKTLFYYTRGKSS